MEAFCFNPQNLKVPFYFLQVLMSIYIDFWYMLGKRKYVIAFCFIKEQIKYNLCPFFPPMLTYLLIVLQKINVIW